MKVLVTGANGFVGQAVCRRLLTEKWQVAAAVRQPHDFPSGVETRIVDALGPSTFWSKALEGIDAVVHLAGRSAGNDAVQLNRINTEGTLHLAREAARCGVGHMLFMSSIKVNGELTHGQPFTFEDTPHPVDAYARSKWEAEQGLAALAHSGGGHFNVTIFRPPLVYGPHVGGNFRALMRAVAAGWPLPLGAIDNHRSMVFIDNLADAVAVALREPGGATETFLIGDGEDISTPELIRRVARLMDRSARLLAVSPSVLAMLGRSVGREGTVRRFTGSLQVRDTAFRQRFDWTPPFTLDQGLKETVGWFTAARPR